MTTFLAITALFMVMFGFMAFALWFAKYRQEGRACCSTGIEELLGEEELDPCLTCPRRESEECTLPHDHAGDEVCEHHGKANVNACALENDASQPAEEPTGLR